LKSTPQNVEDNGNPSARDDLKKIRRSDLEIEILKLRVEVRRLKYDLQNAKHDVDYMKEYIKRAKFLMLITFATIEILTVILLLLVK